TDLLAQLVDEDHDGLGARDGARQLAQRLAHEARLEANVAVAHVALDFRLGNESRDRVDHHDVHCARTYQDLADLERLLTRIRLRDQQRLDVYAQLARVLRVERMLGIDVGGHAALALCVGYDVEAERGLTARLRAVDLGDTTTGNTADAD